MDTMDRLQHPHGHRHGASGEAHAQPMTAEEFVASLRMGKKTTGEIRLCLGSKPIPVRVLSMDEVNAIRNAAIAHVAKTGGDETDKNLFIQKTTLQLASQLTPGGVSILTEAHLKLFTTDEMTHLYNEFIRFMDTLNPSLEQIEPQRFREIIDALKKNILSPSELSLLQLRAICIAFVDLIQRVEAQTSPADSSPGGQPAA